MGDFKRSGGYGGRGGGFNRGGRDQRPRFGGGGRDFGRGGRDGGRGEMFSAICAECNKACEVSFRPTGEKPVYCNECFRANKSESGQYSRRDGGERRFSTNFSGTPHHIGGEQQLADIKKQLDAVIMKIDKIMAQVGISSVVPIIQKQANKKSIDEEDVKVVVADALGISKKKTPTKKGGAKKKK